MPKIDFKYNTEDRQVLELGLRGYHAHAIADESAGFTVNQVLRRLKKGGVQLRDYRNRTNSKLARYIDRKFDDDPFIEAEIKRRIRAAMREEQEAYAAEMTGHKIIRLPRKGRKVYKIRARRVAVR